MPAVRPGNDGARPYPRLLQAKHEKLCLIFQRSIPVLAIRASSLKAAMPAARPGNDGARPCSARSIHGSPVPSSTSWGGDRRPPPGSAAAGSALGSRSRAAPAPASAPSMSTSAAAAAALGESGPARYPAPAQSDPHLPYQATQKRKLTEGSAPFGRAVSGRSTTPRTRHPDVQSVHCYLQGRARTGAGQQGRHARSGAEQRGRGRQDDVHALLPRQPPHVHHQRRCRVRLRAPPPPSLLMLPSSCSQKYPAAG